MNAVLEVICADITRLEVDAIVNAANTDLCGGGGVDGAIHAAAGPALASACRALGRCPTGEVRITPAFQLPSRFVIHAVGPVWHGGQSGEAEALASCYRNAFRIALLERCRSIAFSCISTGVYGYPKGAAARIALAEMRRQRKNFERIVACCFSADDVTRYQKLIASSAGK